MTYKSCVWRCSFIMAPLAFQKRHTYGNDIEGKLAPSNQQK